MRHLLDAGTRVDRPSFSPLTTALVAGCISLGCGGAPDHSSTGKDVDSGGGRDSGAPKSDATKPDTGGSDAGTNDAKASDSAAPSDAGGSDSGGSTGLHVVMGSSGSPGHIVDGSGKVVQLHGVDRSGTEYSCLYGSFFDGPADQTGINAMLTWNVNAVRVPLNADCWLGINGAPAAYSGTNYQNAIQTWVNLITTNGMIAIVDLHWTAPGTYLANAQTPMADADHAPTFWSQVASMFATNGSVIFDLFNEPYITDWTCWLSGGECAEWNGTSATGSTYEVAGMASLLQAVRNAGAKNVVILGGLGYSSDMSQWVTSVNSIPTLPAPLNGISIDNVAVSWHAYDFNSEQSGCPSQYNGYTGTCNSAATTAMNTSATDVLAAGFPLVIGESGISAYSASTAMPFSSTQVTDLESWYTGLLTWAESQGQGYLAWSWNTDTPPILLTDYTGDPSPYFGVTYQNHLKMF
jgi:endoglucanase